MFLRTQTNGQRTYLLLVENQRVDGHVRQQVLCRLGRLDELRDSGQLDLLLQSLGRFSDKYVVLGAHCNGQSITTKHASSDRLSSLNACGKSAASGRC